MNNSKTGRICPIMALRLAAPHTWAASVLPVFLGAALSLARGCQLNLPLFWCMLAVCVLMQSAVNTINDYSDYIKGTDTIENSPDATDAVLVYEKPEPKHVLLLGFIYLAAAACFGIPVVIYAGVIPLIIGILGGLMVLAYSLGKKPLSYLPLGELVSGFVMGALIPLAVYCVFTGRFELQILLFSIPAVLGIGLIMMTNNSCDTTRDNDSGRKTLPVLVGEKCASFIYRALLIAWAVAPEILLLASYSRGAFLYPGIVLLGLPKLIRQLQLKLSPESRIQAMDGISSLNIILGLAYICALLLGITA